MTVEIISRLISTKVWDQARIKLVSPGSAVGLITDCAMRLGRKIYVLDTQKNPLNETRSIMKSNFCIDLLLQICKCIVSLISECFLG